MLNVNDYFFLIDYPLSYRKQRHRMIFLWFLSKKSWIGVSAKSRNETQFFTHCLVGDWERERPFDNRQQPSAERAFTS